jgi:riboflavin kinase/FMN adenylyltransferase
MSADEFISQVLVDALGARHIVEGHDFKFGRNMAGSVETLRAAGPAAGFAVTEVPPFEIDGERVSSSLIRAALEAGDIAHATRLLGRPYRMTGRVVEGAKLSAAA